MDYNKEFLTLFYTLFVMSPVILGFIYHLWERKTNE
jgi:hypothetical protein